MFLRQLFDSETWTYTYLIADEATGAAALIDPVLEKVDRDLGLIAELGFRLTHVFETHVHADHITAAAVLRERTGAVTVADRRGAACVDLKAGNDDIVRVGNIGVHVLETPGHTDDSLSYLVGTNVFTGDALFIRGSGRADFQNGDPGQLFDSITKQLFTLPDTTTVWPGHDYKGMSCSTIGEEKRFNPRLAGKSRADFIKIMNDLHLPAPRKLAESVPANLQCGRIAPQA